VRVRAADFDARVDLLELGAEARVSLLRRDELMEFRITPGERPVGGRKIKKIKEPTEAQQAAFRSWLKKPEVTEDAEGDEEKDDEPDKAGSE
jgi:predicted metalloprotease with PDZ domain